MASPPGGGRTARPSRAKSGPAKRKDVRIFAANSGSIRAVLRCAAQSVTVPAFKSRETRTPKDSAAASMERTSLISGTFSSVTGSSVRSAAAIIGRTAFLFPGTRCVPDTLRPPRMTNSAIVKPSCARAA